MSDGQVFVVYSSGPDGSGYPYGVFDSQEEADKAREAIIKELDEGMRGGLDDEKRKVAHRLVGTLDELITIEECEIRSEFDEDDLNDLFMEYD